MVGGVLGLPGVEDLLSAASELVVLELLPLRLPGALASQVH